MLPIRDDVLFADDAGRGHRQRPENPAPQEIAVELAGATM
jgi:hypothetical protein